MYGLFAGVNGPELAEMAMKNHFIALGCFLLIAVLGFALDNWHYSHTPLSFLAGAFPFDSGLACLTPFRRERAASSPRTDDIRRSLHE